MKGSDNPQISDRVVLTVLSGVFARLGSGIISLHTTIRILLT